MLAVIAAALTFFLVFFGVWEFLRPWRLWGDAALWPKLFARIARTRTHA